MAQINHYLPDFLIAKNAFRSRHPGRRNAIVNDPFQLSIRIALDCGNGELRNRRGHPVCERYTSVLPIEAMAGETIVGEVFLSSMDVFVCCRQRIAVSFPTHGYILL